MIRRAYIIGTVAVGLALTAMHASPAILALKSSARQLERCVRGIQGTSSALSPMERLVFGLVLANTKPPQSQVRDAVHAPRI